MQLQNTQQSYGQVSKTLHWVMALMIIFLFALGKYMMGLDYYDPWYQKAPELHLGLGILTAFLLIFRFVWRLINPQPTGIGKKWEQRAATYAHRFFYVLIAAISISGYLVTTAEGQAVQVFNLFEIPASVYGYDKQEDISGEAHEWLTDILIALVVLHTLASLKHHFINKDETLRRMFTRNKN